jgi:hypothetical protein
MVVGMTAAETTTEAPISVREFALRTGISYRMAWALIDTGEIEVLVFPSRKGAQGKKRNVKVEVAEVGKFLARAREAGRAAS